MRAHLSVLTVGCILALGAHASIETADFETVPSGMYFSNLTHNGFRFSPNCHFDLVPGFGTTSNWIGFDLSGCLDGDTMNPDYIGPEEHRIMPGVEPSSAVLFVDRFDSPFSLLSLEVVTGDWTLTSSDGGTFTPEGDEGVVSFSGPEWSRIDWLLFETPAGTPMGFDNLVADVPTSGTLSLLMLGLAGLMAQLGGAGVRAHRNSIGAGPG